MLKNKILQVDSVQSTLLFVQNTQQHEVNTNRINNIICCGVFGDCLHQIQNSFLGATLTAPFNA